MEAIGEMLGSDVTTAINAVVMAAFCIYKLIKKFRGK